MVPNRSPCGARPFLELSFAGPDVQGAVCLFARRKAEAGRTEQEDSSDVEQVPLMWEDRLLRLRTGWCSVGESCFWDRRLRRQA